MADLTPTDSDWLTAMVADEAVWAQPPEGIEAAVVEAVGAEAAEARFFGGHPATEMPVPHRRLARRVLAAVAAVALVAAGFGVGWAVVRDTDDDAGTEVALAGTDLAPDATATATVDDGAAGVRIILDVTGLDPAPSGSYYEAWVRTADGSDGVSAGTFHLRGGDAAIELWAGVPLADYPLVTVTVQTEGEGTASSGRVVLRGTVDGG